MIQLVKKEALVMDTSQFKVMIPSPIRFMLVTRI